jgi:hypothetical protein
MKRLKLSWKISPWELWGSRLYWLIARKYSPPALGEKRWRAGSVDPRTPPAASSFA